ncbi:MAG: hypothetical protein U1C18_02990 [Patescibacteria group bacterium]|nr:hypothetical protein [bacterium]MDZ4221818.1 hypothetical protein [Patescibacteria group bacterium]
MFSIKRPQIILRALWKTACACYNGAMRERDNNALGATFRGLGVGQSVLATRQSRKPRARMAAYAFAALALLGAAVLWFGRPAERPLAHELANTAAAYASIDLGGRSSLSKKILFWKNTEPSINVAHQKLAALDLLSLDGVGFGEVLDVFSGYLEFAELESGELVVAGMLSGREQWLSWAGVAEAHEGEAYPGFAPLGGMWEQLAPSRREWVWFIRDSRLYIASSTSVLDALNGSPSPTLANTLASAGAGSGQGVLYVSDTSESSLAQYPVFSFLMQHASKPWVLDFDYFPGKIVFSSPKLPGQTPQTPLSSAGTTPVRAAFNQSHGLSALYIPSAGEAYKEWMSGLTGDAGGRVAAVIELLGAYYNLDMESFFGALEGAEVVFARTEHSGAGEDGVSWIALASSAPAEPVARLAETMFAVSHPLAEEIELADGTAMVELRAGIEGLSWEPLFVRLSGEEFELSELRAAGEGRGLVMGEVPGSGMVLTNDVSLISALLEPATQAVQVESERQACDTEEGEGAILRLDGSLFASEVVAWGNIELVAIAGTPGNGILGCILLSE